jgi:hypothetical protein
MRCLLQILPTTSDSRRFLRLGSGPLGGCLPGWSRTDALLLTILLRRISLYPASLLVALLRSWVTNPATCPVAAIDRGTGLSDERRRHTDWRQKQEQYKEKLLIGQAPPRASRLVRATSLTGVWHDFYSEQEHPNRFTLSDRPSSG